MKLRTVKFLSTVFFLLFSFSFLAQNSKKNSSQPAAKKYPNTFVIKKNAFDKLFLYKINEVIVDKSNTYLNQSTLLMNTKNGDMKFLKIKLNYFKNAFLLVQVNGEFSTQVFIMSDDKSVFYKGKVDKGSVSLTKCTEDEIVSE
jgi:hypothetical protein